MMSLVTCTECGRSGLFKIEIKVTPEFSRCETCFTPKETSWTYYFCESECLKKWMNKIDILKGVPCAACQETGYSFGFSQNGICKICNGNKIVSLADTTNN
jgi:hypothetical protein